jgi:hypothetical protein
MRDVVERVPPRRRVRVERGIYRQTNGKYAVCFMLDGKPRFRTVGNDLELARAQRLSFVRAAQFGVAAVVQVSRILGYACPSTTLDIYAHTFDEVRHAADVRSRMAGSAFAGLLENNEDEGTVITLPAAAGARSGPLSARQRAAIKRRLDQDLTDRGQVRGKALTAIAEKEPKCRWFGMELAGLEPATSWVRSTDSPAGESVEAPIRREFAKRHDSAVTRGCARIIGDYAGFRHFWR